MSKKSKILKILLAIILLICITIIGLIIYEKATINNQYLISEKNLEIPIFLYHNIVKDESEIEYDYMQTTAKTFEKQLLGLKKEGYHFISYKDLKEYKNGNKKLYKKSCLLTFDDGNIGVYENAFPIMKKHEIPFAEYIIPETVGSDGTMTWEQLRQLKESGLGTIASHSMKHEDFTKLTAQEALENVNNSYEIIEQNLGKDDIKIFTYPYGLYTNEQIRILRDAGYIQNLTDNKINASNELDLYGLHRCYPLSDSIQKINLKILYRSIKY